MVKMNILNALGRPTWAEIDLSLLGSNIREFQRMLPDNVKMMAVIKADGYGHGAVEVARVAIDEGVSMLGVASLEEGLALRLNRVDAPILILGHTCSKQCQFLLNNELTPSIFDWETASSLSSRAESQGRVVGVHVKCDTGMGRLGLSNQREALHFLEKVCALPGLRLDGVFTHFSTADEGDRNFTLKQLRLLQDILKVCREKNVLIPLKHAANSAAAINYPETHLDMVRIGIGLYGYYPSKEINREKIQIAPVASLKTRIILLKRVSAGTPVSYGRTFVTLKDTSIAVVPLGYGDGYSRSLSNVGTMLVRGQKVPIVGMVCMDMCMLDVSNVPYVKEGDEVVAIGTQGDEQISADDLALQLGTISYEVLCNISPRVPRIYYANGMILNKDL